MKNLKYIAALLVALLWLSSLGLFAQDLGARTAGPKGGYSLRMPSGWRLNTQVDDNALHAIGSLGVSVRVVEIPNDTVGQSLAEFAATTISDLRKTVQGFKLLDTSALQTRSGLKAEVILYENEKNNFRTRIAIYIFEGRPGYKIYLTGGSPATQDSASTRAVFEEVAQTVKPEK